MHEPSIPTVQRDKRDKRDPSVQHAVGNPGTRAGEPGTGAGDAPAPAGTQTAAHPPSLKALATQLGLSTTTVSRVMSPAGASRISPATRARVLEAAARMGYQANVLAQALRSRRSATVGVMVPEISEGYSTLVLSGIEDALVREGYFYFVVSHRQRKDLLQAYPRLLLARAVEGIIAINTLLPAALGVPATSVSGHQADAGIVNIQVDHAKAARAALEHLHRLGHRQIACIKGQIFSADTEPRWKAIVEAAKRLGLIIEPALVARLAGHGAGPEPGREAARVLLSRGVPFTALFAFNDLSAIGAIAALREAGLRVPQDVSVVGFDDIQSAATNDPALTTVRQPLREMGGLAAETLLRMIRSQPVAGHVLRVFPTLVARASTSKVNEQGS